jgi:NAD(P)H-dependent FMN reductase
VVEVVARCPTGALRTHPRELEPEAATQPTTVELIPVGPLVVRGDLDIEGERELRAAVCCRGPPRTPLIATEAVPAWADRVRSTTSHSTRIIDNVLCVVRESQQLRCSPHSNGQEAPVTQIGIILGSTRPNRNGEQVAKWVLEVASARDDAEFELVDLRDYPLPHLDEPLPPSLGQYANDHTKQWAAKIASFDGFVIVTPEYNHGTSGVLKNAIDFLYAEWNNKAVGFVSYGAAGGARAAEHLRLVAGELQMADVRQQVVLSLITEFENFSVFKPGNYNLKAVTTMIDQVVAWSTALASLRAAVAVS